MHHSIDYDRIQALITEDNMMGICRLCGEDQPYCDPDTSYYTCEICGAEEVFGAEEYLFLLESYFE